MNFDTSSFQEFKEINNLDTEEALDVLLSELEKLKQEVKRSGGNESRTDQ